MSVKRNRHRYLITKNDGPKLFTVEEIKKAMNSSINELFGIVGLSRIKPKIIEFDQKMQRGIIRCNHSHLREIRAALTLINNISGIELAIHVERISGTLKSIRNFSRSNSNLRK